MHQLVIAGKRVQVYPSTFPDRPVVYLNTFEEEGDRVYQILQNAGCPAFTLAAISGLAWDHDMAPWEIPPVFKGGTPPPGRRQELPGF